MNTEDFTAKVVGIIVAVIVIAAVAIPVINSTTADIEDPTTKTIINVIPIFLILAVLMAVVYMFLNKNGKN